jgi:hypothetical protein
MKMLLMMEGKECFCSLTPLNKSLETGYWQMFQKRWDCKATTMT